LNNPHQVIKEMYLKFGYNIKDEIIDLALKLSSKENMRRLLKEKGDPKAKNPNFQFIRKGVSGEGKQVLSKEDLKYIKAEVRKVHYITELYKNEY